MKTPAEMSPLLLPPSMYETREKKVDKFLKSFVISTICFGIVLACIILFI